MRVLTLNGQRCRRNGASGARGGVRGMRQRCPTRTRGGEQGPAGWDEARLRADCRGGRRMAVAASRAPRGGANHACEPTAAAAGGREDFSRQVARSCGECL